MKFIIDRFLLIININGKPRVFPNTDSGFREMARQWLNGRAQP